MMRSLLPGLLLVATTQAQGADARVEALIRSVEALPDAQFVRNGSAHDPKKAAEHLRLKLRESRGRCDSAEEFIRLCASRSSVSGKPYEIRFSDGTVQTSEAFLRARLKELAGR